MEFPRHFARGPIEADLMEVSLLASVQPFPRHFARGPIEASASTYSTFLGLSDFHVILHVAPLKP